MTGNGSAGIDRVRIVECLREQPGLRPADIARIFEVHPSTAEYHLRRLARQDRIARVQVGRELHHYVIGDGLCQRSRQVHARLTPAGRCLLRFALDQRIFPRQAIVQRGFTPSAVRWALDRLEEVGAVERLAWGVYELKEQWRGCVVAALREAPCVACNDEAGVRSVSPSYEKPVA